MKIFGKELFKQKVTPALYDFAQHGLLNMAEGYGDMYVDIRPITIEQIAANDKKEAEAKKEKAKGEKQATPKELFVLGTLNRPEMTINTDAAYIAEQVSILQGKLDLYPTPPKKKKKGDSMAMAVYEAGAVSYGRREVESMIERLKSRQWIGRDGEVTEVVDEYTHTTNDAIRELLSNHKHLIAKKADDTIPDLPKEAIKAMKKYTDMTDSVVGKRPVFYLIVERPQQQEVARRRDPILLAQSPFGFFWQILGAWDKEVVFLEEL